MSRLLKASEEQKIARDRLAWSAWGGRLSVEQFLQRERRLRAHPWAAGGMVTWLWVDDHGAPLASCETFTSASYLDGVQARSYAVASVFTEPALRGQGHASRMMDALVAEIRSSDPSAHSITLYSDVGEAIYARSGFAGGPAFDWEFEPCEGSPEAAVERLIGEADLPALAPPAGERFLIWPDRAQIDWHLARERFYAEALQRRRDGACGAVVGGSLALWAADFKNDQLVLLLLSGPTRAAVELLVLAARQVAHRLALPRVSLWEHEPLAPWLAALPGGRRCPRDGSLPMILPLQPALRPEHWRLRPRALWV